MVYNRFMSKSNLILHSWQMDEMPPGVTAWPTVVGKILKNNMARRQTAAKAVAVHLITGGKAVFSSQAGDFHLERGDMLCMWPDVAHDLREVPGEGLQLYWTRMNGPQTELLGRKWGFAPDQPVRRPETTGAAEKAFDTLFQYWSRSNRNVFQGLSLFYNLVAVTAPREANRTDKVSAVDIVSESKLIIESLLETGINVNELADMLHVSRITLWRAFKEETGRTPHEWILHARIHQACHLLRRPDMTLHDIANMSGFNSEKYFMRCFKSVTGQTPSQWRYQSSKST